MYALVLLYIQYAFRNLESFSQAVSRLSAPTSITEFSALNSVRFSYAVSHTTHAFNKLKRSTLFSLPLISSLVFNMHSSNK